MRLTIAMSFAVIAGLGAGLGVALEAADASRRATKLFCSEVEKADCTSTFFTMYRDHPANPPIQVPACDFKGKEPCADAQQKAWLHQAYLAANSGFNQLAYALVGGGLATLVAAATGGYIRIRADDPAPPFNQPW